MAVDSTEIVDPNDPTSVGRVIYAGVNISGISGIATPNNPSGQGETAEEEKQERRIADAFNALALDIILNDATQQAVKNAANDIWTSWASQGITYQSFLQMSDEEQEERIKEHPALAEIKEALQQQFPDMSEDEIEKLAVQKLKEQLIEDAKAQIIIENQAKINNLSAIAAPGLTGNFGDMTPEKMVASLNSMIVAGNERGDEINALIEELEYLQERYGPDKTIETQIEELNAASEQQVNMNVFISDIALLIEETAEARPDITPKELMIEVMMNEKIMNEFEGLTGGVQGEEWRNIIETAATSLGLAPQAATDFIAFQTQADKAIKTLSDIKISMYNGAKTVLTADQLKTDGISGNAAIFGDSENGYFMIDLKSGTRTEITEDHHIAAIEAKASEEYLRIGTPREAEQLTNAFYNLSANQLAQAAKLEQIYASVDETDNETAETDAPRLTPDEAQAYITKHETRIVELLKAHQKEGISPDMLKMAIMGMDIPLSVADDVVSLVINMPEANIIGLEPQENAPAAEPQMGTGAPF